MTGNLEWVVQLATAISLLIAAITGAATLREYRLKLQAEKRQQESTQAEIDLRMIKLFVEVMQLATGYGNASISEKAIEQVFEKGLITQEDFNDPTKLNRKLSSCFIYPLTASPAQNAAIAALQVLSDRYEILYQPAKVALESLQNDKSLSEGKKQIVKSILAKFEH